MKSNFQSLFLWTSETRRREAPLGGHLGAQADESNPKSAVNNDQEIGASHKKKAKKRATAVTLRRQSSLHAARHPTHPT